MTAKKEKSLKEELSETISQEVNEVKKSLDKELDVAKAKVSERRQAADVRMKEYEDSIKDKPFEWVAGAFVAGILLGKILSK